MAKCLRLCVATRRGARKIGGDALGFGGTTRQGRSQRLFRASVAGALPATLGHAIHFGWVMAEAIASSGDAGGMQFGDEQRVLEGALGKSYTGDCPRVRRRL